MNPNDKEAFCEVVAAMAVVHGKPADAPLFAGWWMAMQRWELKDFQDAACVVMATSKFMPTPAAFNELKLAGQTTPGEAWNEALGRCTQWRTGRQWGDRIERAARCVGGYQTIAMADIETSLPHIERRFLKHYEELCDVEETRKALPNIAVPALEERAVGRLGYDGDEE